MMMLHHIKKSSSTLEASLLETLHQLSKQANIKPKNKKVVRVMDKSFLDEESINEGLLDQISLRSFKLTDVDDIMLWAKDKRMSRYWGGGWGRYKSKKEALEDLKKDIIPHLWFKAICLKNRPIGKIFVHQCEDDPWMAELGYVVAPKLWGKGIATTAVKLVLDTVFKDQPQLERLEAMVDVKNLGSLRVVEKSGFLKEGVLRKYYFHRGKTIDMAMFSFLNTDFKLG